MAILLTLVGTMAAIFAMVIGQATLRIQRASSASYNSNRVITGSLQAAVNGRISPAVGSTTDYQVNHFADLVIDQAGEAQWVRAGSLSDEAVDSVLVRHG